MQFCTCDIILEKPKENMNIKGLGLTLLFPSLISQEFSKRQEHKLMKQMNSRNKAAAKIPGMQPGHINFPRLTNAH